MNGGTYTLLLNTTNKRFAAAAAGLTFFHMRQLRWSAPPTRCTTDIDTFAGLNVFLATFGVLGFFALLNILGLEESSVVALVIFVPTSPRSAYWRCRHRRCDVASSDVPFQLGLPPLPSVGHALFFGFAAAMLGVSGFESSANFIEQQKRGVFPKTLRNMWITVIVFNPLISLLSFGLLPLATVQSGPPDLLARMGERTIGRCVRVVDQHRCDVGAVRRGVDELRRRERSGTAHGDSTSACRRSCCV